MPAAARITSIIDGSFGAAAAANMEQFASGAGDAVAELPEPAAHAGADCGADSDAASDSDSSPAGGARATALLRGRSSSRGASSGTAKRDRSAKLSAGTFGVTQREEHRTPLVGAMDEGAVPIDKALMAIAGLDPGSAGYTTVRGFAAAVGDMVKLRVFHGAFRRFARIVCPGPAGEAEVPPLTWFASVSAARSFLRRRRELGDADARVIDMLHPRYTYAELAALTREPAEAAIAAAFAAPATADTRSVLQAAAVLAARSVGHAEGAAASGLDGERAGTGAFRAEPAVAREWAAPASATDADVGAGSGAAGKQADTTGVADPAAARELLRCAKAVSSRLMRLPLLYPVPASWQALARCTDVLAAADMLAATAGKLRVSATDHSALLRCAKTVRIADAAGALEELPQFELRVTVFASDLPPIGSGTLPKGRFPIQLYLAYSAVSAALKERHRLPAEFLPQLEAAAAAPLASCRPATEAGGVGPGAGSAAAAAAEPVASRLRRGFCGILPEGPPVLDVLHINERSKAGRRRTLPRVTSVSMAAVTARIAASMTQTRAVTIRGQLSAHAEAEARAAAAGVFASSGALPSALAAGGNGPCAGLIAGASGEGGTGGTGGAVRLAAAPATLSDPEVVGDAAAEDAYEAVVARVASAHVIVSQLRRSKRVQHRMAAIKAGAPSAAEPFDGASMSSAAGPGAGSSSSAARGSASPSGAGTGTKSARKAGAVVQEAEPDDAASWLAIPPLVKDMLTGRYDEPAYDLDDDCGPEDGDGEDELEAVNRRW